VTEPSEPSTGPDEPFECERALAVYGTLAPGQSNHHMVADIDGRWYEVAIRGQRFQAVWSGTFGYPGFTADPDGPLQPAMVLASAEWADHWDRLDRFEGPGYERRVIEVFDRAGQRSLGWAHYYETLVDTIDRSSPD
jgi:gamma-glutamylcyclotransferase (GGCT)/AIG2-like uncharacterized protein YtfP